LFSLKKIVKGSLWVILSTVITRFVGFLLLPILARFLGPTDLGLYNLITNTVQSGDGLSRLGTDVAIHRNGSQFQTIGTEAVGRLFGVGACITILAGSLIALSLWIWRKSIALYWLGEARSEYWLGLAAIIIVLNAISNPSWYYLLALHQFRIASLRSSGVITIGAIGTLFLTWQFRLTGALIGLGVVALLQAAWGWWLIVPILRDKQIRLRFNCFLDEARSILSFGLPFYASNFISSFIALPLLGYVSLMGGIEQLGYLRVAQSLSQFITFLPTAISPVIISILSANILDNIDKYQQIKFLHLRSLWLLNLVLSTAICFSLDYLVPSLFGTSYSQAILLSRLTVWIAFFSSFSSILGQYLVSAGKTKTIAIIQTTALGINTLFAILLIPYLSSIGFLISQAIAALFTATAYIKPTLLDMNSDNRFQVTFLSLMSLALILISVIASIFSANSLVILVAIVLSSITLLMSVHIIFTSEERFIFISTLRKIQART
jgi:O-antigen/teichoic acid export membrane protein